MSEAIAYALGFLSGFFACAGIAVGVSIYRDVKHAREWDRDAAMLRHPSTRKLGIVR